MTAMRAWAIKHWNGGIYIDTVRRTRGEAIAAFKEQYGIGDRRWRDDRRAGVHRPVQTAVMVIRRVK